MSNKLPFNFPILSVRQPYANQIIYEGKDVENRNWRPNPPYFGPLYIHAAQTFVNKGAREHFITNYEPNQIGGVIGVVRVVGYKKPYQCDSIWAIPESKWLWVLENPNPIDFVKMRGRLSLFYGDVEEDVRSTTLDAGIIYARYA